MSRHIITQRQRRALISALLSAVLAFTLIPVAAQATLAPAPRTAATTHSTPPTQGHALSTALTPAKAGIAVNSQHLKKNESVRISGKVKASNGRAVVATVRINTAPQEHETSSRNEQSAPIPRAPLPNTSAPANQANGESPYQGARAWSQRDHCSTEIWNPLITVTNRIPRKQCTGFRDNRDKEALHKSTEKGWTLWGDLSSLSRFPQRNDRRNHSKRRKNIMVCARKDRRRVSQSRRTSRKLGRPTSRRAMLPHRRWLRPTILPPYRLRQQHHISDCSHREGTQRRNHRRRRIANWLPQTIQQPSCSNNEIQQLGRGHQTMVCALPILGSQRSRTRERHPHHW